MKQRQMIASVTVAVVLTLGWSSIGVQAQTSQPDNEQRMQQLREGCQQDLQNYCSTVTPGRMRLLACIYAHQDKLSARCLQSFYNTAPNLERGLLSTTRVGAACQADIQTHCANAVPGGGGIVACLRSAESQLSSACQQALQQMSGDEE